MYNSRLIITIGLIILALYLIIVFLRKLYISFVLKNSYLIKKLKSINSSYSFNDVHFYNKEFKTDNEIYYSNISCEDYLIYSLVKDKDMVLNEINNAKYNNHLFIKYNNEINYLEFGGYEVYPRFYIRRLLNYYEKKLYKKYKLRPTISYTSNINLYLTTINGRKRFKKYNSFDENKILELINRIDDKSNKRYNDREIWDSICRIERAKVTNRIRFMVYKRDGYRCQMCGRHSNSSRLEIDHIYPISKGGKTTIKNLQTLCHECNQAKGSSIIR